VSTRPPRATVHGLPLAVVVCVLVAVAAGTAVLGPLPDRGMSTAAVSLAVDDETLTFVHRGGPTLVVADLRLVVSVDGTPLRHQPPVPFFAARGYRAGPTGPFNRGGDGRWSAGERATLTLASTNRPDVAADDLVRVRLVINGRTVATVSARAD